MHVRIVSVVLRSCTLQLDHMLSFVVKGPCLQAAKRSRDSESEEEESEEDERPKKHNRAAALASSKAQPAALMTSKRVGLLPCHISVCHACCGQEV